MPWAASLDPADAPTPPPGPITGGHAAIPVGVHDNSEAQFHRPTTDQFPSQSRHPGHTGTEPTTDQYQVGSFTTGGFTPVERLTGQFSVDQLASGAAAQGNPLPQKSRYAGWITEEITNDTRFRFGIWGGSIGTIIGILLGVVNAFFEGVPLANAQLSLIGITLLCMLSIAATCAWRPRQVEALLREYNIIKD
jgi:hypothetical protein